ncbi:class I SAM-dependent methyltransferase [Labrenzia sp. PHM005]|uniref:class I SAM-dependent methyltransferase n=1 Tax=Labrenzia sp. PHM005 TaxID=2590016 RepID=UPI0011403F67|nr:class I SAM-dependent methyltransferase [Labrenzia sp. PHM005]QDG74944.1 methyltransferase domain-containing protein [Labrenzia sp. PHM005]
MQDWSDGYVADIEYNHGFYRELAPAHLSFASLTQGFRTPSPERALNYCELGCGQGVSMNILAAANPHISFYATDFNPGQITSASRLAEDAGLSNLHFYDAAFDEFEHEPSLPRSFDIISLHGIYSWISAENRAHIVRFLQKKLKPGGLVYISYNTLPGWAVSMPLRQLLVDHATKSTGPITTRIDKALSYAQDFNSVGTDYFSKNDLVIERLKKMAPMPRNYLAHEYFNKDWTPFYFSQVADELAGAKLSFLASAHVLDQVDMVNLTGEQQKFLASEPDPLRRQSLRDYIVNQQFRRDIFVKGGEKFNLADSRAAWLDHRFTLVKRREDVPLTSNSRLGEVTLNKDVYDPILDGFSNGPATIREILKNKQIEEFGWQKLQQALAVLVGAGDLQPCLTTKNEKKRRESAKLMNRTLIDRSEGGTDISFLASPVTGSGVAVNRIEQLFLNARIKGMKTPSDWAASTWEKLDSQGHKLKLEGKTLENPDDNLTELNRQAKEFEEKTLPVLSTLQVI